MIYVFDMDGTLSLTGHRQHHLEQKPPRWDKFFAACVDDPPNEPVIGLNKIIWADVEFSDDQVWIVSGRSDEVRQETVDWLARYEVGYHKLLMRKEGDYTPDDELKREWMKDKVGGIAMVFDDRDKVVKMWRDMGVPCCQVASGDF